MQNLSDNELDDLFRKAVQNQENSGAELSDWARMADRLEKSGESSGWHSKMIYAGLTVFLIGTLSVSVILLNQENSSRENLEPFIQSTEQPKIADEQLSTSSSDYRSTTDAVSQPVRLHSSTFPNEITGQQTNSIINDKLEITEQAHFESFNPGITKAIEVLPAELLVEPLHENELLVLREPVETSPVVEQEKVDMKKSAQASRKWVALKISAAPDFSSIGFSSFNQAGWNLGVLTEFHFNDRLSLAAGVLRSRKLYSGKDLEYNGYAANKLYGDCWMWDIPVNLYYHFPSSTKWSFFSGLGVSSYIMSRENYVYYVDSYSGTYRYTQDVVAKNNEWFKMLNISIGIQKQIDNRLVLQVEPYLKAPLAGVGEGDVSLASFGAFFSIKYNFLNPK